MCGCWSPWWTSVTSELVWEMFSVTVSSSSLLCREANWWKSWICRRGPWWGRLWNSRHCGRSAILGRRTRQPAWRTSERSYRVWRDFESRFQLRNVNVWYTEPTRKRYNYCVLKGNWLAWNNFSIFPNFSWPSQNIVAIASPLLDTLTSFDCSLPCILPAHSTHASTQICRSYQRCHRNLIVFANPCGCFLAAISWYPLQKIPFYPESHCCFRSFHLATMKITKEGNCSEPAGREVSCPVDA